VLVNQFYKLQFANDICTHTVHVTAVQHGSCINSPSQHIYVTFRDILQSYIFHTLTQKTQNRKKA